MAETNNETTTVIKYISLENLQLNNTLMFDRMDAADAKALKTVALSVDGKKLIFYTESEPVGSTPPAFEIELPETDLTPYMQKIVNALSGDVATFGTDGSVVDSGVKLEDLATKAFVETKVAQGVAGASALTKQIVTTVPTADQAVENTIYLLKVESSTGPDKYEEYTLISGEMVMIGDTSTDLADYFTKEQAQAIVDTAKQEAITTAAADATSKADKALADSKAYTDAEVAKVADRTTTLESDMTSVESDIADHTTTLTTYGDKITTLENKVSSIETATEADIRAMFA